MYKQPTATREPLYVTRPFLPPRAEYDAELDRIFAAGELTNGSSTLRRFAAALTAELELAAPQQVSLFANGHLALEAALRALAGDDAGGEVITTPFTFASTVHAIVRCGLTPVFCDVKPSDLTMDEARLPQYITARTRLILPVHVYGHSCSPQIDRIAKQNGIPLLYDGAHAFGVTEHGKSVVLRGDMTMLSFHATKPFHTIEGGALVLQGQCLPGTARLLQQARELDWEKNFGYAGEPVPQAVGGNGKMNAFEAAMGLCCLRHLPAITVRRRALTWRYREALCDLPGLRFFTPDAQPGLGYNYAYFPVCIDEVEFGSSRDRVWQLLRAQQVYARRYFWPAVPDYPCYRAAYPNVEIPVARRASAQVLCLPLYDGMSFDQVDRVCALLRRIQTEGGR